MERVGEKIWFGFWSFFTTNLGTKLVSVGVAIVLWVVVMGSRTVEATKEVPVEIVTPPDLVPSNEVPDRIAYRLSGPKALLSTELDRRYEPIRINLSGAKAGLVTYRIFSDSIHVPIGVKVLAVNPNAILVKLEPVHHKEVLLRPVLVGQPGDGFHVVGSVVRPLAIRIKGAETRVDAIHEISTSPIDVTGQTRPFEQEVPIDLSAYNVQLDGPPPRIAVDIEPTGTGSIFRIPHVDVRVQAGLSSRVSEKNVTVVVRADPRRIAAVDKNQVYAEVDLRGKPKGKYTESLKVNLPSGLSLVKILPEQVDVTLY